MQYLADEYRTDYRTDYRLGPNVAARGRFIKQFEGITANQRQLEEGCHSQWESKGAGTTKEAVEHDEVGESGHDEDEAGNNNGGEQPQQLEWSRVFCTKSETT